MKRQLSWTAKADADLAVEVVVGTDRQEKSQERRQNQNGTERHLELLSVFRKSQGF